MDRTWDGLFSCRSYNNLLVMTPFFIFRSGNLKETAFIYRVVEAVDYVLGMITTTLKLCKINEVSTLILVTGKNEYKIHQWSLKKVTTNRRITFVILFKV